MANDTTGYTFKFDRQPRANGGGDNLAKKGKYLAGQECIDACNAACGCRGFAHDPSNDWCQLFGVDWQVVDGWSVLPVGGPRFSGYPGTVDIDSSLWERYEGSGRSKDTWAKDDFVGCSMAPTMAPTSATEASASYATLGENVYRTINNVVYKNTFSARSKWLIVTEVPAGTTAQVDSFATSDGQWSFNGTSTEFTNGPRAYSWPNECAC